MRLRTSIDPDFLKKTLFRGLFFYLFGFFLIAQGFFLKPSYLKYGGILFFFVGVTLIGIGLLPYKRLKKWSLHPHELTIEDNVLFYQKKQETLCKIPLSLIEGVQFEKSETMYGLGINFCKTGFDEIDLSKVGTLIVLSKGEAFQSDLVLPFFSKRSFEEFKEALESFKSPPE